MGATPLSIVNKPIHYYLESAMNFELIADQAAECLLSDLDDKECVDIDPIDYFDEFLYAECRLHLELISGCSYQRHYYESTLGLYRDLAA
jgi:hypothetical protein